MQDNLAANLQSIRSRLFRLAKVVPAFGMGPISESVKVTYLTVNPLEGCMSRTDSMIAM